MIAVAVVVAVLVAGTVTLVAARAVPLLRQRR